MRPTCLALVLALSLPVGLLPAQGAARMGRVRGTVLDSLLGTPLAGASVRLVPTGRSAQTDSSGRFAIDSVPPGEFIIAFHHPALDSLGFPDITSRVRVFAGASASVLLATPSFENVLGRFCAGTPDSLSPTVAYGGVRSAGGARVRVDVLVTWIAEADTDAERRPGSVRTESADDGQHWVACGIPEGAWLRASVRDSTRTASALLHIGPRGLISHDLLLSDGETQITGTVRTAEGEPVPDARIAVVDTDRWTTTDASGSFTLERAPAGTITLDIRAAGYRAWIGATEGQAESVAVQLGPLALRDAASPRGSDHLRLIERQARRGMALIAGQELRAPGLVLASLVPETSCRWWLDGRPVTREFFLAQPQWTWRAVESYARGEDAPPEYRSAGCAVALLWTAAADW